MILIQEKSYSTEAGQWNLSAIVTLQDGTRSGSYVLSAPPGATDEQLSDLLMSLFLPVS